MAWYDKFLNWLPRDMMAPVTKHFAITASDVNDLANIPRGIILGVGGDVKMCLRDNSKDSEAIIYKNLPSGVILPLRPRKIFATGTTATDMIGVQ